MIAHLRGNILSKDAGRVVLDCGGVGYELTISVQTYARLPKTGDETALHVYTSVREDAIVLFGFAALQEKQLFEKLISVSGIGPKLAIALVSAMPAEQMVPAILGNDVAMLIKTPGIGRKTAERMVLELKDKLEGFGLPAAHAPARGALAEDVVSALMNLGYQKPAAEKAAGAIPQEIVAKGDFESMFREALAVLRK